MVYLLKRIVTTCCMKVTIELVEELTAIGILFMQWVECFLVILKNRCSIARANCKKFDIVHFKWVIEINIYGLMKYVTTILYYQQALKIGRESIIHFGKDFRK